MMPSSLLRLPRRAHLLPQSLYTARTPLRSLSSTSQRFAGNGDPDSGSQRAAQLDREKMDTGANETSKSGTDHASAANEEAAFDPNITDPQEAKRKAGEGNEVNPLDASPANPEISSGTSEAEGGSKKKQ